MSALVLAAAGALLVGVTLGMLGGGGTILALPLLVYGLSLSPKVAIATSLVVVATTAAASLLGHARAGHVRWRMGLLFGGAGMVGAYAGGVLGAWLPSRVLLLAFAAVMLATAIAMLHGRRGDAALASPARPRNRGRALAAILLQGLGVGAITGLVGAGGGFLVVPALVLLGGLSMRDAVGTSLLVIALNATTGLAGYAGHVEIDWTLAATMSGFAIAGSLLGTHLGARLPQVALRRAFAIFVLVMGAAMVAVELLSL